MKLAVFLQDETTASAWYRYTMPFSHIAGIQTVFMSQSIPKPGENSEIQDSRIYPIDACFFLRPCHISHVQVLDTFKSMGKSSWIDFDDDLFAVPYHHSEWEFYQLDSTKKAIIECCKLADVITVTTHAIKQRLLSTTQVKEEKIHVVPNAIDDYLFPDPTNHIEAYSDYICWRGGKTHDRDLQTIGPAVSLLTKKNYRFVFVGHKPSAIQEYLTRGQYSHIDTLPLVSYFHRLKALNAPFHVIPLERSELNAAKSNIAFLEAAWIGGSLVFMPERFQQDDDYSYIVPYADGALAETIQHRAGDLDWRKTQVALSQAFIRDHFLLSRVNDLRRAIVKQLFTVKTPFIHGIRPLL